MTTREFIAMAGQHWMVLLAMFLVPPVAAWLCGVAHGKGCGGNSPWKYCYSVLVYLSCVPGTFAAVITAYTLFFTRENLLDVNPLVYFLPLASMVATLVMVMIACSFVLALAIQKTKIWIVFGGSVGGLFLLAAGIFALLKWGVYMLFRRRDEPKQEPPAFPNT